MNPSRKFALLILFVATIAGTVPAAAQRNANKGQHNKEWYLELRQLKHDFLKKELKLTRDQENAFFPLYDRMDDELFAVAEDTRSLERRIKAKTDATDVELEAAARATFEQKRKESDIELKYFEEFKKILSKRQLLNLKEAERRLNRKLVEHARKNHIEIRE